MKKAKLLPLYIAVTAGLYGVLIETSYAAYTCKTNGYKTLPELMNNTPVVLCTNIDNDDRGYILSDTDRVLSGAQPIAESINASGDALTIGSALYTGLFVGWTTYNSEGKASPAVNIISTDGDAIKYIGDNTANRNIFISTAPGSTVSGKTAAINITNPQNNTNLTMRLAGNISGDILTLGPSDNISIEFGRIRNPGAPYNPSDNYTTELTTKKITGVGKIDNYGDLIINGNTDWDTAVVTNNGNIKFQNVTLSQPLLKAKQINIPSGLDVISADTPVINQTYNLFEATSGTIVLPTNINVLDSSASDPNTTEWVAIATEMEQTGVNTGDYKATKQTKDINSSAFERVTSGLLGSSMVSQFIKGSSDVKEFVLDNYGSTIEEAQRLTRDILPDLSGGDIEAAFNYVEKMRSHIGNRTLRYSHQLPEEEREHGWNVWATTDYSTGKNKDVYGYKLNRYGLQVGFDQQINDQALLGFSLGLNRNHAKNEVSSSKKTTQFIFMPYYEWRNDLYFAEVNSNFGILRTQSRRDIGNTTASGSYSSFQFGYQVLGGIETQLYRDLYIKPYASLKYQWMTNQGWHETGSPLALAYESQKYSARHVGGGISLWKAFETSKGSFVPSLNVEYYRFIGSHDKLRQKVSLASSVSETGNVKGDYFMYGNALFGDQLSVKLNASLDLSPTFNITGSAGYNRYGEYKESAFGLTLSNRF
ncbi:uncharacterized protein with beta-barrel porin domain [Pasteurella langaaensis DSM 22999]|uniref:Uncharacterized protein with beta-barrel porin domain n=1 Tax=Alitibacter langaaensis DSM 22999 TaxID=1122935 RepID=A0A2U0TAG6_9PAST|nr:autotransporter outer membrane beta-barrel domain-containing protein [Pasteurella langaaensis]PVX40593.1 uncharacterized protein with beta-barrel porin domain [Pasteurella langaaensis DSM 22999]